MIKKILVIGCGSIGSRHARNLKYLGLDDICLCDTDILKAKKIAEEIQSDKYYDNYKKAFESNSDIEAVIIATPSIYHIEEAIFFAEKKVPIFIEKPLAVSLDNLDKLISIVNTGNVVNMMGQSYRFHEGFLELKKIIDDKKIGQIYHVNFFGGQYLPSWHPKEDYKKGYAASRELGGGVMFTSMSHALDTISWLFGEINQLCGWKENLGNLDIQVDDSVFLLAKTKKNIVVMCQYDFLQKVSRYKMDIVAENMILEVDFIKKQIVIQSPDATPSIISYDFDQNKRYIDEMTHFLSLIDKKVFKHDLDFIQGKKIVELMCFKNVSDKKV